MSPDWPKALDAQRRDALAAHGAEPGQRQRMAVEHGDQRAHRARAAPAGRRYASAAAARSQSRCSRSGEVTTRSPTLASRSPMRATASIASGSDRAHGDDGDLAARRRRAQPIGAGGDVGGKRCVDVAPRLLERAGREAEIDRAAVRPLHVIEAPAHDGAAARRRRPARTW